jgi:hypothetical protein
MRIQHGLPHSHANVKTIGLFVQNECGDCSGDVLRRPASAGANINGNGAPCLNAERFEIVGARMRAPRRGVQLVHMSPDGQVIACALIFELHRDAPNHRLAFIWKRFQL